MHKTAKKALLVLLSACSATCLSLGVAACDQNAAPPTPKPNYENPQTATFTATVAAGNKKISDVVVTWTNRNTGIVAAVAHTNADGVATCNIVPADYSVTIVGYSTTLYANKGGAKFADGATTDVEFELTEIVTSTYSASVIAGAEGLAGAGIAWVNAETGEIAATMLTDSDGYATTVLETGDYYAVLEEYSDGYINNQGTLTATAASPRVTYSLTAMTGVARPTTPYYAYVTSSSSPVEGVGVVFYDGGNVPVYATYTDENGSVRANITNALGASGEYTVKISGYTALGYTTTVDSGKVTLDNDRADFEIERSINASNSYNIKVTSQGGMALRGVTVNLMQNGVVVASGITNSSGRASIFCEFGDYTVSFSAPTGFTEDEEAKYEISTNVHDYTFSLKSAVIESTVPSNKVYAIGDVMYDFSVRDAETNEDLVLSSLLEKYKAVVLNFWYIGCGPCRMEFPFIQEAYEDYDDRIAFVALSNQDTAEQIRSFKTGKHSLNSNVYTFNMGYDNAGLTQAFNVAGFPTTVVVDRYGVVAYATSGNDTSADSWKNLFETYVSDDYTQDINQGNNNNSGSATEREHPDVEQDAFDETFIGALANDKFKVEASQLTGEDSDPYSWPFNVAESGADKVISATNVGHDSSYAILYVNDIAVAKDKALVFEYDIVTESNADILYAMIDTKESSAANFQLYATLSGNSGSWQQCIPYVSTEDKTISLAFCYRKNSATSAQNEHVYIKNLNVIDISEATKHTDVRHDAAIRAIDEKTGYSSYVTPTFNENDGYYHVGGENGPLLYIDMLYNTPYSRLHIQPSARANALYYIALRVLGTTDDDGNTHMVIGDVDYTEAARRWARTQSDSDNGLLPVSKEIYDFVQAMLGEITKPKYGGEYGTTTYENQWLEFCSYYVHYGNKEAGERCDAYDDPTVGMMVISAISIDFEGEFTGLAGYSETKVIDDYRGLAIYRGTRTKFTAPATGVYSFYVPAQGEVDPEGSIVNPDAEENYFASCGDFLGRNGIEFGFKLYAYLEKGETTYVICGQAPQMTGKMNLTITYESTSAIDVLTSCDLGLGTSSYEMDENGNPVRYFYNAIPVILGDDDYYYALVNGEQGSKIYLDFLTENAIITAGMTVKDVLDRGGFNLLSSGGKNYTTVMTELYNKAISRDKNDPLYGLVEVNSQTAQILHEFLAAQYSSFGDEGDLDSNKWVGFCWYLRNVSADHKYHSA